VYWPWGLSWKQGLAVVEIIVGYVVGEIDLARSWKKWQARLGPRAAAGGLRLASFFLLVVGPRFKDELSEQNDRAGPRIIDL